ncbi:hypothetical protein KCP71_18950 [Salmonella enterica subsp. enterica]|nr:hypothetical protein KCP71_18950 [Salmonella enterica subsp. enterica]
MTAFARRWWRITANFARHAVAARARDVLHGPVRWPASIRGRNRLLRIGLIKLAGFKIGRNHALCVRLALFKRS